MSEYDISLLNNRVLQAAIYRFLCFEGA